MLHLSKKWKHSRRKKRGIHQAQYSYEPEAVLIPCSDHDVEARRDGGVSWCIPGWECPGAGSSPTATTVIFYSFLLFSPHTEISRNASEKRTKKGARDTRLPLVRGTPPDMPRDGLGKGAIQGISHSAFCDVWRGRE